MTSFPNRGEIWRVDLNPVRGHEQGATRTALIVSNDILNHGSAALVCVVPLTSKARPIRSFLPIHPPEGGLSQASFIICDQVRTLSKDRLGKRLGAVSPSVLLEVDRRLKFLLNLH
jgi:mRNA interferase MazF